MHTPAAGLSRVEGRRQASTLMPAPLLEGQTCRERAILKHLHSLRETLNHLCVVSGAFLVLPQILGLGLCLKRRQARQKAGVSRVARSCAWVSLSSCLVSPLLWRRQVPADASRQWAGLPAPHQHRWPGFLSGFYLAHTHRGEGLPRTANLRFSGASHGKRAGPF